ncbi:MAG: SDR family oxidoreductase [Acidobacteria bacterium]|nr:SDR family oxidoreductase [Acidobacteriota bacterium]
MAFSRTIFITGFPGFIAGRLVAALARPDVQFFLLVEPHFVETAARLAERIAADMAVPPENFALIEGDITKPGLGMSTDDLAVVRRETTDVHHLAAIYDLAVEREPAFAVNVEGTRNVNELCRSLANLRRYNYVSTCYVSGKREGRILEAELEHDAGFRNSYEETKYLAEMEVERLKADLPVTVFRPSVVVGDSETGETVKYDGIYYLIKYVLRAPSLLRLINVGNNEVTLNLVPVDFVVESIAALCYDEAAVGRTVALADPRPLTTAGLFDAIARSLTGKASIWTPPKSLSEWSLYLPTTPALTGLPHAGVPYFFVTQEYDTAAAEELLAPHGVRCPGFAEYVGRLIEFVKRNPRL